MIQLCYPDSNRANLLEAYMFLASTVPAYAIGFFITIILFSMGFNLTEALLLSAPPTLVAVS